MSLTTQFKLFADYNSLMNQRLYEAAATLSDQQLKENKGAFFGSVLGTLNHILVGDIIWLKRFAAHPGASKLLRPITQAPQPEKLNSILYADLAALKVERERVDLLIKHWVDQLVEADLNDVLAYRNTQDLSFKRHYGNLISHLFLHQIHHRGQITTLLSQFGIDFGETDIIEIMTDY